MNHVVISPGPGEMGYGCKCGKRFPTKKTADIHAADQNLIEENEAKAQTERHSQPVQPNVHESQPESANSPQSAETENEAPAKPDIGGVTAAESTAGLAAFGKKVATEPETPTEPQSLAPVPAEAPQALSPSNMPLTSTP